MLYTRFLTCCIQRTNCGPVTFLHLSTESFNWMVVTFVTRPHETGCLFKQKGPEMRKYSSLFSIQLYPFNVASLPNCCNITLTVLAAMQNDFRNSRLHVGTDCLQRINILELLRPFVLLLRHGYCLVKNIKSIRELVMFKNKEMDQ